MSMMGSDPDLFDFGAVALVRFLFTDQISFKQRPAVVVNSQSYHLGRPDLVIMAITSQIRSTLGIGEVWIDEWQAAGLLKPSSVKPVFATIERGLVLRRLGDLRSLDRAKLLREAIALVLG